MSSKKQTMQKLLYSPFFDDIRNLAHSIAFFSTRATTEKGDQNQKTYRELAQEALNKWEVVKAALLFISGKTYVVSYTDEYYGIVNEQDESEWLYKFVYPISD